MDFLSLDTSRGLNTGEIYGGSLIEYETNPEAKFLVVHVYPGRTTIVGAMPSILSGLEEPFAASIRQLLKEMSALNQGVELKTDEDLFHFMSQFDGIIHKYGGSQRSTLVFMSLLSYRLVPHLHFSRDNFPDNVDNLQQKMYQPKADLFHPSNREKLVRILEGSHLDVLYAATPINFIKMTSCLTLSVFKTLSRP